MDCERAVETLIDRAAGDLDDREATALAEHLRTCARCRAEAAEIDGLWNDLGALRAVPGPAHTDALARRLHPHGTSAPRLSGFARAAVWVALLLGAGAIGRLSAPAVPPDAAPAPAPGNQWMLLLHEDPEPSPATPEVVAQYARWGDMLRADDRLVFAQKLDEDAGTWLPERPAESRITGFFIVRASDPAEAAAIARSGPHLSRGGAIEVRRIDLRGGTP